MENKTIQIVLAIIFILLLFGFGGFYYLDRQLIQQKYNQDKEELQQQINDLEKNLKELKSSITKPITCASTLTSADKTEIKLWQNYTNSKYHYSFKYPETWEVFSSKDDIVNLKGKEAEINFQFRSGNMTVMGYEGYKIDKKEDINVACKKGVKTYFVGDTSIDPSSEKARMIFVQFEKNDIDHLIILSYKNEGASVSGNITKTFDLILKTIEFK